MKNFGEFFLNFYANFLLIFRKFSKVFDEYNVLPEQKFWLRYCSTGREKFMYETLFDVPLPPEPKFWCRPFEIDIIFKLDMIT